jgi:hypothetical protein
MGSAVLANKRTGEIMKLSVKTEGNVKTYVVADGDRIIGARTSKSLDTYTCAVILDNNSTKAFEVASYHKTLSAAHKAIKGYRQEAGKYSIVAAA